jgi:hypothetical protein
VVHERGEGRIGFIIALALAGAAVFVGVKIVPVRIAAYEFHDTLRQEARYAAVRDSDAVVAQRIMERAGDLEIPLERKNLEVRRSKTEVVIKARYEQPIDLAVTTYLYSFKAEERAPLF